MKRISIVNGPNLNLLGTREPEVYGSRSFDDYLVDLRAAFSGQCVVDYFQSNVEGEIINQLQGCMGNSDGVVLNAGGYTHTSIAIADTIAAIGVPVVEVHISNIMAREAYRKTSVISSKCVGTISGLGLGGYALAIRYLTGNV
jgi:3-dehydroquinate dehydratase-2